MPAKPNILRILELLGLVDGAGARVVLHDVAHPRAACPGRPQPQCAAFTLETRRHQHAAIFRRKQISKHPRRMHSTQYAVTVVCDTELARLRRALLHPLSTAKPLLRAQIPTL